MVRMNVFGKQEEIILWGKEPLQDNFFLQYEVMFVTQQECLCSRSCNQLCYRTRCNPT